QTAGVRLVFSDLVMPRLGGRALYDAARREGVTVPFLFASGYSDPDRGGSLDPALPLMHKPWMATDLLGRIRAILDRKIGTNRSEEHTSELQSRGQLVCRLLLEKKKTTSAPRTSFSAPSRR